MRARAIVLAPSPSNRVADLSFALTVTGATSEVMLFDEVISSPETLRHAQIVAVVGRHVRSAHTDFVPESDAVVADALHRIADAGTPIVGIGSGFQFLSAIGLLPGSLGRDRPGSPRCQWVTLEAPATRCVWTQALAPIECPYTLTAGRYSHPDIDALANNGQVALRYLHGTPNGSMGEIAGVCDASGIVLGLAPQPELHVLPRQHPQHRMPAHRSGKGLALSIFERGIHYAVNR